jgi:16S rRNA (adenine1518-N6/adenine1519-N6)-dimethyltransferase
MATAASLTRGDVVLEIGPGTGMLTESLLATGATVHAIETDSRALAVLQEKFSVAITAGQLLLHVGDVRTFDLESLTKELGHYKVIANIPYYLSGFLLRTCLEQYYPPKTLVFLMQKELVERIVRDPKSSLLSLSVKVYGEPRYVKTIGRNHFKPAPKVDSAILAVEHISNQHLQTKAERDHFFSLLHKGLGHRRKQLFGILAKSYDRELLGQVFAKLDLLPTVRGEDCSLSTWLQLTKLLPRA